MGTGLESGEVEEMGSKAGHCRKTLPTELGYTYVEDGQLVWAMRVGRGRRRMGETLRTSKKQTVAACVAASFSSVAAW